MSRRRKRGRRKRGNPKTGYPSTDQVSGVAGGKMSEIIVALARPWIDRLGPAPPPLAVKFVYLTSGLIWNVSRLPDPAERQMLFEKVSRRVVDAAPEGMDQEVFAQEELLYRRAVVKLPEDRRIVINMSVQDLSDGNFHVLVASALGAK